MVYQGFSLLPANREVVAGQQLATLAQRHYASPSQIILRSAIDVGMIPLTGTTSPQHMQADLSVFNL